MKAHESPIAGVWEFAPDVIRGDRGIHIEPYEEPDFSDLIGRPLSLGHLNIAISAAGALHGIHFAEVPPGQAKYITCAVGAFWDVAVDLRIGSPTFGRWNGVLLDDQSRRAVFLEEGLGHGYVCLADNSVLVYVSSQPNVPEQDHTINPFDTDLDIPWPRTARGGGPLPWRVGNVDRTAPSLAEAREQGLLPDPEAVRRWTSGLRAQHADRLASRP